jgi:protein AIR1/2
MLLLLLYDLVRVPDSCELRVRVWNAGPCKFESISAFSFARAMTSTAVVEIIDLTDTDPPIDDDTYKIQKSENYKEGADPEKNAVRTAHKRKNGEVGAVRSHPVESVGSRDVSVERDHEQSGEGATELQPVEDSQGRNEECTSTKKRKRRSKKGKDKDKESAPSSREDTQHDALANLDDGQLFFIDTEPASVPTIRAFESNDDGAKGTQSSSQTPKVDKDRVPLLLPAHVSVFAPGDDLPVQIVQSADSDSDAESYIEYLDYDDRLVRR